jgi:hypothetical protein
MSSCPVVAGLALLAMLNDDWKKCHDDPGRIYIIGASREHSVEETPP